MTTYILVSFASQTAFFRFLHGSRKKGLDQFTDSTRPDTCECVNKLHHKYLHSPCRSICIKIIIIKFKFFSSVNCMLTMLCN